VRTIYAIEGAADIHAVVICTPTDTQADLIERLARAGKAIFCEKPVDLDVARVQAALKVVAETKAVLMVGFNRRFAPDFLAVRAAIDAGQVGEVEMVTITSRDPGAPPLDYIARCQRRSKIRPLGGAKPGQWRGTERHGARARHIAGACHGAQSRRAKSARGDQVLAPAFRARLWPSR